MDERLTPDFVMVRTLEGVARLDRQIWPLQPKKNARPPFVFYIQSDDDEDDTLGERTGLQHTGYEVHVVTSDYRELAIIGSEISAALSAMVGTAWARADTSVCNVAVCTRPVADIAGDVLLVEDVQVRQVSPDLFEKDVFWYRRVYQADFDYQTERSASE